MDNENFQLIKDSYMYLRRLFNGIKDEADKYRQEKFEDASNVLLIAEGLQFSLKSITLLTTIEEEDPEIYKKTEKCLQDLAYAIENKDNVAMIDVLEYEISDLVNEWKEVYYNILNS